MTLSEFQQQWFGPEDYIEAHTSGSTGSPKPIRLPKADMKVSARATNAFFGIDKHCRLALPLSLDYIAGKMMAVRAFEAGCTLDVIDPSNDFVLPSSQVYELISIVPSQVSALYNNDWSCRLKNVLIGGAPLHDADARRLVETGYNCYCSYGMTETCSHVALSKVDGHDNPYQAMPGVAFDVDDRGCLVIEAPAFSFGRLVTNDIVQLLDDHSFVWRGRYDNVINTGGVKVHPEELEKKLLPLIDVPFYIVGVEDEKWGTRIELVVEAEESQRRNLAQRLAENLNHVLLPKKIHFLPSLPRTANGKILRKIIE